MKYLRIILVVYALASIVGALFLIIELSNFLYALYLLISAAVAIAGSVFESKRYKPESNQEEGWQKTGERFVDDSSGKLMEVYYNPKTGERSYREVEPPEGT
jgi:hypothetical protein